MKKLVSFFAATALVAALMTTSSCTKTCDAGYEGSDCKTLVRAKYLGTWTINGHDNATPQGTYTNKDLTIAAMIPQANNDKTDFFMILILI